MIPSPASAPRARARQEILELFDRYVLSPNYAWAEQVAESDKRIATMMLDYDSPKGQGKMKGYFAKPATLIGKIPGVVVVHENRGLTPYIETWRVGSPSPTSC